MRRTKIVCTLGPATSETGKMLMLIQSGMDVARINLSHGSRQEHRAMLTALREASNQAGQEVAVLFDTRGPEVRLGRFIDKKVFLKEGDTFLLTPEPVPGDAGMVQISYERLAQEVSTGQRILVDDGNICLVVEGVTGIRVICRVVAGGWVSDGKKVSIPGISLSLPYLMPEDMDDIVFAAREGVDFLAASFIRDASDVISVKRALEKAGGRADIIAKIETRKSLEDLDNILKVSDGLMIARGDLGVELEPEDVPLVQKDIIARCTTRGKVVITATQMLESMMVRPRPTRAEASDVANAILDGTDAVMLSGETAVGDYPLEACSMMARIASRVEGSLRHEEILTRRRGEVCPASVTEAISYATCSTAEDLGAKAIITATSSGHTARMVARYRPRAPVVATTPQVQVLRKLLLVWGVKPLLVPSGSDTDTMINASIDAALRAGTIGQGDLVVLSAGIPVGVPGTTNMIKVHTLGDVILRGTGIGRMSAVGKVRLVTRIREASERFEDGDVLVASTTDKEFTPFMERAAAVVTEEAGLTSHAAIVGLSLGIPVVVGAIGAMGLLRDGMEVTVDGSRGLVYRGRATVL